MCLFVHKNLKHIQKNRGHSLLEDVLEDVFKSAVIGFKNGVLCAHVQWPLLANGILEAAVCKACNRLLGRKIQTIHNCGSILSGAERLTTFPLTS